MTRRESIMTRPKDSKGAFRRLLSYLGAFKAWILLVAVLCLISNVLSLWGPSLAGSAINEAAAGVNRVDFEKVTYYAVRMLAVYACSSLITILIHMIMVNVSKRVGRKMRQDVFDKLMRLPVGFFDRNQAGDIISRVSYDVDVISTCMATDVVAILCDGGGRADYDGPDFPDAEPGDAGYGACFHRIYRPYAQKNAAAVCEAVQSLRSDERLCGGTAFGPEDHPGLCL